MKLIKSKLKYIEYVDILDGLNLLEKHYKSYTIKDQNIIGRINRLHGKIYQLAESLH